LGYGITGNQEIDNNLDARFFVPSGTAIDPESGETVISFSNDGDVAPNPDLKWEENSELNLGLDFGLFSDRLSGSIEYYVKTTNDLIYRYDLPVPPNRNRFIYANAGEIENKGIEVTLQGFPIQTNGFTWKSILTYTRNKQETISLGNELYNIEQIRTLFVSGRGLVGGDNYTQLVKPGFEIGTFFLPHYAGLFPVGRTNSQGQPVLGDNGQQIIDMKPVYETAEGGFTLDVMEAERRAAGSAQPDFIMGWTNSFDFAKGFDASFSLRAVVGHDIYNSTRMTFSNPSNLPTLNVLDEAVELYDQNFDAGPIVSDFFLEDGSFLRLDNLSIGYTPKLKSKTIQRLRIYATASNVFTVTGYSGVDPELSYGGLEFGLDQFDVYPKTRNYTIGANITF